MVRAASAAFLLAMIAGVTSAQAPKGGPVAVAKTARVDAAGDPLPLGAVARFGTVRLRHAGEVMLAFTPDGRHLASVGADQAFQLWAADSGKELRRYTNPSITLHSSGGEVIFLRGGGRVVLRAFDGRFGPAPVSVAFSPSGQWLATVPDNKTAVVWNTATGDEVRRFTFDREPRQRNGRVASIQPQFWINAS